MARIQPVLTPAELALVDQMAELTGSKRTEVIKSALAVYHWFVGQAITGSCVVARKATGEEVAIETAELYLLEGHRNRLSPGALGVGAKRLAAAPHPVEAGLIQARVARGCYGLRVCWPLAPQSGHVSISCSVKSPSLEQSQPLRNLPLARKNLRSVLPGRPGWMHFERS